MVDLKKVREVKPIVSDSLSDAAGQIVLDGVDAGFDFDEIAPETGPKIRAESKFSQNGLDELTKILSRGSSIPGQSLVNSPDQKYAWEQPPEYPNPKDALDYISSIILQKNAVKEIVQALAKGAAVGDIAMAILYTKFTEGKFNPDVLLLLAEPVMFLIMAIGEEANIKYNIEGDDLDEFDYDDENEIIQDKLKDFENALSGVKNVTVKKTVQNNKIPENVVPQNLLDRVKEQGPEIRGLLSRGKE
tara:strand:+ start:460 stop:1197 length:738 start_codon:yes stop_codon:yes gene_type:complete